MSEVEGYEDFDEHDYVMKTRGYLYPGMIVSRFNTSEGKTRFVVESVALATKGMLHIFSAENLRPMTVPEIETYVVPWREENRARYEAFLKEKRAGNAGT